MPNGKEFHGREGKSFILSMSANNFKYPLAIKNVHYGMWYGVLKRLHRPKKIFPFGDGANELVITGTVEYWKDDGSYEKHDIAVRANYQINAATHDIRMSSLQVWLTG